LVEWAADGEAALVEDVGVDHGGFDVGVAEEFLDGANVVAILQEVGGEAVAEGVGADALGDASELGGFVNGFLHAVFVQMVAALCAAAGVGGEAVGGEDVLPEPVAAGVGVFTLQSLGQVNRAEPLFQVMIVPLLARCTWAWRAGMTLWGRTVARSFSPLPSRTMRRFWPKSTSLTRSRRHSMRRRPLP